MAHMYEGVEVHRFSLHTVVQADEKNMNRSTKCNGICQFAFMLHMLQVKKMPKQDNEDHHKLF